MRGSYRSQTLSPRASPGYILLVIVVILLVAVGLVNAIVNYSHHEQVTAQVTNGWITSKIRNKHSISEPYITSETGLVMKVSDPTGFESADIRLFGQLMAHQGQVLCLDLSGHPENRYMQPYVRGFREGRCP